MGVKKKYKKILKECGFVPSGPHSFYNKAVPDYQIFAPSKEYPFWEYNDSNDIVLEVDTFEELIGMLFPLRELIEEE